ARRIELPELKSACLGGVYAVKGALRYLALDGRGRQAIVVSADIALYARGSSGEETQGAGAVAQLLEEEPALYAVDLEQTGSAAEDRGLDFRKPLVRSPLECGADIDPRSLDFPVFNGKYTTVCYIDEVLRAVEDLLQRTGCDARTLYHEIEGVFMHRPYHRLPRTALAALYVRGLRGSEEHRRELGEYCAAAGCDLGEVLGEMSSTPDLLGEMLRGRLEEMVYPQSMKLVRFFRSTARFFEVVERKMQLGAEAMKELGNLYCAALPAWIAAGLEEARAGRQELAGRTFLTIGYGSGDAAEAMLIRVAERWREAASRIGFASALLPAIDLDQEQYALLHAGHPAPGLRHDPRGRFVVDRVGCRRDDELQDIGIEYYCYVPCSCSPDLAPAGQGYGEE
ncbi:MAG: hydroxymethylglutaryl-CoA synthase, partial [Deltaproteobacteria bacterium]|nr:hydroxymethylglutaryl-CoA synthase [Deltaproteobacteria bacterium]